MKSGRKNGLAGISWLALVVTRIYGYYYLTGNFTSSLKLMEKSKVN